MEIGIISANPQSWRMQEFLKAARKQKVKLNLISPFNTRLDIRKNRMRIVNPEIKFNKLSSSIHGGNRWCFPYILLLLQHMEEMKIPLTAGSHAVWKTRNKFATLQAIRAAGIPTPNTSLTYSQELALKAMSNVKKPFVLKLLDSSSGRGVMKANSYEEAESLTGTLKALDQLMIIQEYLEHPGEDIRAFIVGNEIVGSMKRKSKKGMWKTNISRGARGIKINLREELQEMALKTAEVLETKICGIDILESKQGPVILEANITPGFKGLLKYTGVNPAPKIIRLARDIAKK